MADGIIGYPFDSILTFDEDGNPTYDRAVPSKVLKTLISKLFTTGVMPNPSNNLLVTAGTEGMTTVVEEGFCVIEGGLKLIVEPQTMMHQASDTNYDRIDTVVMRWDNNDNVRHCGLFVVAGTPATSPVRPTLTREGSIYEIGLADVLIKANSTVISANRITDTRYDDERCGVVRSISEYDTTYIYQQVQADLAGFKENEQAEFVAWFETIRGILDEEVAGHLQLEIDDLKALIKPIGEATVAENTWTAVEAKKGDKIARLQMNADGDLILFQSVDNGETWEQKEIGEKPNVMYEVNNDQDDWVYINVDGVFTRWRKAFMRSLVFFNTDKGYNAEDFGALDTSVNYSGATASGYIPTMTATINPTNIDMILKTKSGGATSSYAMAYGHVKSHNYIDLTRYTKLFVNTHLYWSGDIMTNLGNNAFTVEIVNAQTGVVTTIHSETKPSSGAIQTDKELELDLSQYSGDYYIQFGFAVSANNYSERVTELKLANVYLS